MSFNDLFKKEVELREAEDKTGNAQPGQAGEKAAAAAKADESAPVPKG